MPNKTIAEKWLALIYQSMTVAIMIGTIIYFPIKQRFAASEMHTARIEKIIQNHCDADKDQDLAVVEFRAELKVFKSLLLDMKQQLKECQETDRDLRNKIYEFLNKH